ncbi:MAG: entericidin A/B family lipoprotein [Alphaproteobacteria bacterium]|nr:entericidin A/B family lipoprotein [Alphaproteobacteria bacterium]MCD8520046.1 entericidin A/B family lipoprotein [Alphaproteobacteria bacterium]MCD8569960.1 entericidin A/B family lipoprotein [Alphaproteobacteria bacterium]
MRFLTVLILASLALTNLSACSNTADGFGRDMEKAGEKIQKTF